MQQENEDIQAPMSDIWQELLGNSFSKVETPLSDDEAALFMLKSDPWSELLQVRGVEAIDVQQLHLHMSDQDVELVLQFMQEDQVCDESSEQ